MSHGGREAIVQVGLIAGNGQFPLEFLKSAKERGVATAVVAHRGETDPRVADLATTILWVRVGEIGKTIAFFKNHGVSQVAFLGGISRIQIFKTDPSKRFSLFAWWRQRTVWLDWRAVKILARVGGFSDDKLLRGVAREFEREHIEVISPSSFLVESVVRPGPLTSRSLTKNERRDAATGWLAAERLGELDIGQTVVVADGVVTAIEAIEGTDRTIARAGVMTSGKAGVVVKRSKPQQDTRLDLPSVGIRTIEMMVEAGATALVLEAGKVLLLHPQEVTSLAEQHRIAIEAFSSSEGLLLQ